jgi:hypothetical protein
LILKVHVASLSGTLKFHDAMISVESSQWGNFRGCIPADHASEVGAFAIPHVELDGATGFDAVEFYRYIATELAEREQGID